MNRIIYNRSVKIIDDDIVSKKERDLSSLYNYLSTRDFTYFPALVSRDEDRSNYEYIMDYSIDDNQKGLDIIDTMSLLHNKTSFKKEISRDKNKKIYRSIKGYIKYLESKYNDTLEEIEYIEYPSPSQQLFLNNFSKIMSCLSFIDVEVDNWYKLVKDKAEERVSMIHGKLALEHMLKADKNYLISWDKARIETPVLDFVEFYHKEWENIEFKSLLERYFTKCELNEAEKKLLFINLTIPIDYEEKEDELERVIEIQRFTEYIFKTENLIRPYYSKEQEEK